VLFTQVFNTWSKANKQPVVYHTASVIQAAHWHWHSADIWAVHSGKYPGNSFWCLAHPIRHGFTLGQTKPEPCPPPNLCIQQQYAVV